MSASSKPVRAAGFELLDEEATLADSRLPRSLRALAFSGYRLYWIGGCLSFSSWAMQQTARAWLTLELTNSPYMVGVVTALSNLPMLFASLLGGVLADRFNRRRVVLFCEGFIAVTSSTLVILLATGTIQVWHLLLVALASGTSFSIGLPSRQALMTNVVPRAYVTNAVALSSMVLALSQIVGPAAGGLLIRQFGLPLTFLICGLIVLPALAFFVQIRQQRTLPSGRGVSPLRNLLDGFGYVRTSQRVQALLMMGVAGTLFGMSYGTFVPVIARDYLRVGSDGVGFLLGATGLGGLVGAATLSFFRENFRWFPYLLLLSIAFGASILIFALSPWYLLSLPIAFGVGICQQSFFTSNQTLVQIIVPDELRGRIASIRMLIFGFGPIGQFMIGALAERLTTPVALAIAGGLCVVMMTSLTVFHPAFRRL